MQKLKLYTDIDILPFNNSHTYLLFQKLGNFLKIEGDPDSERFDELCLNINNYFDFVLEPLEADYFLLPFGFSFETSTLEIIKKFVNKAKDHHKKTIVFYNSDDDTDIDILNVVVFRTSYLKSKQNLYTQALPGWSLDFINYFPDKKFFTLPPEVQPSVSYCGYIYQKDKSIKNQIKSFYKKEPFSNELFAKKIRGKACEVIQANTGIKSNFIIRNGFWAAGMDDKNEARMEYAQNLIHSLYGIATRGGGNFSYRLLEILSCGRIPVFINTDSILPFDSIIDWKKHVVWIEEKDLTKIDKLLLDFHKSKTNTELSQMQESNRQLYLEYLSPNGFFKNIHLTL